MGIQNMMIAHQQASRKISFARVIIRRMRILMVAGVQIYELQRSLRVMEATMGKVVRFQVCRISSSTLCPGSTISHFTMGHEPRYC
jgi:hypothetical protein